MNSYQEIIDIGVNRAWTKKSAPCYVEIHHIVPRCLGGTDEKSNLVCLTAKEHYLAHYYLTIMHPSNDKLIYAFHLMHSQSNNQNRYSDSELYEKNKIAMSNATSNRLKGTKQSQSHISSRTRSRWTDEARVKQAEVAKQSAAKVNPETRRRNMLGDKNPMKFINRSGYYNVAFKMFYKTNLGIFDSPKAGAKLHGISEQTLRKRCLNKCIGYNVILKSDIIYYEEANVRKK